MVTRAFCQAFLLLWSLSTCAAHRQSQHAAPTASLPVPQKTTVFAAMADFGMAGAGERRVAELIDGWQPRFIIAAGDNNYPSGEASTIEANIGQYYHAYIRFAPQYAGPYKALGSPEQRFYAALGNHDWQADHAAAHLAYFDYPGNKRYYDVVRGPVHLFILDSDKHEPDGVTADSKQAQWLKAALRASTAPWKIVVMHHPPYSSGIHGSSTWMQWPYREWGADLTIAGHDHHYERAVIDGFPYFVVGTGGAELYYAQQKPLIDSTLDITYYQDYGAILGHATEQALRLEFFNVDGQRIDVADFHK